RLGNGRPTVRRVGKAEPPVVVHHAAIRRTLDDLVCPSADAGEEFAISHGDRPTDLAIEPYSGEVLVKLLTPFAPVGVVDSGSGHEVAFVSSVHEDPGGHGGAVSELDAVEACGALRDVLHPTP